ncbi:hypothetical protein HH214_18890 [Mucilaginibacter robiniae]|uniref:Uncharacterized protein n=1 Tax=Mucilaginibacter robiniae TaxID=2728022 RepID=A0A7L5E7J8_9SPHI|nr:hypothetical protein [Mucilaginibacter robiniae]QJD97794.1 hypothetical protein HH214_18890 [Mucilaginibacter robiniae]
MTIKRLIQTRWEITPEQVTVYPYGAIYIMCVITSIVCIVWVLLVVNAFNDTSTNVISVLWPITVLYLLMIIFFGLFGRTTIIFNRNNRVMYKLLFGFWRTTTLPFDEISGIILMRSARGTFRYNVVPKNSKWWNTSTVISSAVMNENSAHALDFQEHVLAALDKYLHLKSKHSSLSYRKK